MTIIQEACLVAHRIRGVGEAAAQARGRVHSGYKRWRRRSCFAISVPTARCSLRTAPSMA